MECRSDESNKSEYEYKYEEDPENMMVKKYKKQKNDMDMGTGNGHGAAIKEPFGYTEEIEYPVSSTVSFDILCSLENVLPFGYCVSEFFTFLKNDIN